MNQDYISVQMRKSKGKRKSAIGKTLTIVRTQLHFRKGVELLLVDSGHHSTINMHCMFKSRLPFQVKNGDLVCLVFLCSDGWAKRILTQQPLCHDVLQSASSQTQNQRHWIFDVGTAGCYWKLGKVVEAVAVNLKVGLGPSIEDPAELFYL